MALAISSLVFGVEGNRRVNGGVMTGDTSYTSGGYAVSLASVGVSIAERMDLDLPVSSVPAIRAARYDYTNNKLMFFDQAFAEIANGVDLSAYSARFEVKGF